MSEHATRSSSPSLRLWPAIIILIAQTLAIATEFPFGPQRIVHGWVLLVVWWLLISGVPLIERMLGLAAFVMVSLIPRLLMDRSLDFIIFSYVVPSAEIALLLTWVATRRLEWERRRWVGFASALVVLWGWTLVRLDGVTGELRPEFRFRWSESNEQAFLNPASATAKRAEVPVDLELVASPADWPAYRGLARNDHVSKQQLPELAFKPPRELWRRRIGPAWSSFAMIGNYLYTQEQRGAFEAVVCYEASTGTECWAHLDSARFDETIAGVGPRATPTVDGGRVFTVGAQGHLHCLDAVTGDLIWKKPPATDDGSARPIWGASSSPLVVDDTVIVCSGHAHGFLNAWQTSNGELRWSLETHDSYSSPQHVTLLGTPQVLWFCAQGLLAVDPNDGRQLWSYDWKAEDESRILQPCVLGPDGIVISTESKSVRLSIQQNEAGWSAQEVWSSRHLKPDFSDSVAHEGYLFGFDGSILCCLDLETGRRTWRQRGFGKGQLLLIPHHETLLVLSEQGEIALVALDGSKYREHMRFQAVSGKTWNHPIIAQGKLFVRNAAEAVCFEF